MSWRDEAERLCALPPQKAPRIIVAAAEGCESVPETIIRGSFQVGSAHTETESQPTDDGQLAFLAGALGAEKAPRIIARRICKETNPEGDFIDFDAIDVLREANKVVLPADEENRAGLRPLTEDEKRQIRTGRAPLPAGVTYGQTPTGQWRRLT